MKQKEFKAITLTDFGAIGKRVVWRYHYSLASAFRGYRRNWDICTKLHKGACWIEPIVDGEPLCGPAEWWPKGK